MSAIPFIPDIPTVNITELQNKELRISAFFLDLDQEVTCLCNQQDAH